MRVNAGVLGSASFNCLISEVMAGITKNLSDLPLTGIESEDKA
jgi:hypothetical protein